MKRSMEFVLIEMNVQKNRMFFPSTQVSLDVWGPKLLLKNLLDPKLSIINRFLSFQNVFRGLS